MPKLPILLCLAALSLTACQSAAPTSPPQAQAGTQQAEDKTERRADRDAGPDRSTVSKRIRRDSPKRFFRHRRY